ncbi:MAG: hypothetical protein AMXMBFR58_17110 [Phycisphaerae bacterium]
MNVRTKRVVVSSVALALIAVATLAAVAVRPAGSAFLTDGAAVRVPAETAPVRQILWTQPKPVSGQEAGQNVDEYEPRLSADGTTMVFVRRRPGSNADLYWSTWTPNGWTPAAQIEGLNTEDDELGPELSWDGRFLYFYSDREGGLGGYDLWRGTKAEQGWSTPINLGPAVNTGWNEYGPAASPGGDRLYFSSNRPRAGEPAPTSDAWSATVRERRDRHDYDLYVSVLGDAGAETAAPVAALNTEHDEGSPAVSPAGDFLYFASDRPGGVGGFDLYRSRIGAQGAMNAEAVGEPVNTAANELDPGLSTDGFRLYFSSDRVAVVEPVEGGAEDGSPGERETGYGLWFSNSREVYTERAVIDSGRVLAELWADLWPWLALLGAALLLAWIAYQLLRSEAWRRRFGRLSLLAQCVVASVLIHAALASLLAVWKVGSGIIDLVQHGGGSGGSKVLLVSSGIASDVAGQLLGGGLESSTFEMPALAAISADADVARIEAARAMVELPAHEPVTAPVLAAPVLESTVATEVAVAPQAVEFTGSDAATVPEFAAPAAVPEASVAMPAGVDGVPEAGPISTGSSVPSVSVPIPTPTLPGESSLSRVEIGEADASESATVVVAPADLGAGRTAADPSLPDVERSATAQEARSEIGMADAGGVRAEPVVGSVERTAVRVAPPVTEGGTGSGGIIRDDAPVADAVVASAGVESARVIDAPTASTVGAREVGLPSAAGRSVWEATVAFKGVPGAGERAPVATGGGSAAPRFNVDLPVSGKHGDRPVVASMELSEAAGTVIAPEYSVVAAPVLGGSATGDSKAAIPSAARRGAASEPATQGESSRATVGLPALAAGISAPTNSLGGTRGTIEIAPPAAAVGPSAKGRVSAGAARIVPEATVADANPSGLGASARPFAIGDQASSERSSGIRIDADGNIRLPDTPPEPVETFAQRDPEIRGEILEKMGGSEETEAAVRRALAWLSRHQEADGRWTGRGFDDGCGECSDGAAFDADAAMTGMSLLCFLGAGHTHQSEGPHKETVGRALQWVVARQGPDGDLRRGETMYGQTVCAVALCEAFSMTRDPALAAPARLAVEFVINVAGRPAPEGRARRSEDTSVIGWLVMTVESARRAGIAVPPDVFIGAGQWLDSVSDPRAPGRYAYASGGEPSVAMTAEAMFVQQIIGKKRTDARMIQSADFVLREAPAWREGAPTHSWYYATLALFEHQGEAWERWNTTLMPQLVKHQRRGGGLDGSWDPQDEWSRMGGRIYQTAVCTLCLEAYYRYKPR